MSGEKELFCGLFQHKSHKQTSHILSAVFSAVFSVFADDIRVEIKSEVCSEVLSEVADLINVNRNNFIKR